MTKIFIHPQMSDETTGKINSIKSFYGALEVGGLASWFVAAVMLGTFISVIIITIYIAKNSTGEFTEVGKSSRSNWLG
jgi:hypothetical protein